MKKILMVLMVVTLLVTFVGCGNDYSENENQTTESSVQHETDENEEVSIDEEKTKSNPKYNYQEEEETKRYSTTVAISGAIIVEDNHDNNVLYKKKCDSCGYVEPGTRSTNPGGLISSYTCQECGYHGEFRLQTTYSN